MSIIHRLVHATVVLRRTSVIGARGSIPALPCPFTFYARAVAQLMATLRHPSLSPNGASMNLVASRARLLALARTRLLDFPVASVCLYL